MKKLPCLVVFLGWAILILCGACSSAENKAHCTQTYGQMKVPISTQKTINFQQVAFSYTRSRTHLNIGAYRYTKEQECLAYIFWRTALIEATSQKQILTPKTTVLNYNNIAQHSFQGYTLYTDEPHWIQLNSIGNNTVEGVIQASYIHPASVYTPEELVDTVRFNRVAFRAVYDSLVPVPSTY